MQSRFYPTPQNSWNIPLPYGLKLCSAWLSKSMKKWRLEREKQRTLRIIEQLPDEILHDIGWPTAGAFDNSFPGRRKIPAKDYDRIRALTFGNYLR
ncbi:hypothetical protein [Brucella pituitosa]|uniref:hypothetical protein n=1 Tax=Brucella pituitosa TaxID=571256 RepID=UPI00137471B5|nr:hypothetical protein [Brucella pituitosa]